MVALDRERIARHKCDALFERGVEKATRRCARWQAHPQIETALRIVPAHARAGEFPRERAVCASLLLGIHRAERIEVPREAALPRELEHQALPER